MNYAIRSKFNIIVVAIALVSGACQVSRSTAKTPEGVAPVHDVEQNKPVAEWFILGPFPNPELDEPGPGGVDRAGFVTDYLTDLGGESTAEIRLDAEVIYDAKGVRKTARVQRVAADAGGLVDLDALYRPDNDSKVAYAFAYIQAPSDSETICFLGSDDSPKVWVNGELVHSNWCGGGRGVVPREDQFELRLKKGLNRVLVKVEEAIGGWAFVLEPVTAAQAEVIAAEQLRRRALSQLQEVRLAPVNRWDFLFEGSFPAISWDRPGAVEAIHGETEMVVRWFDADLNEVEAPDGPGRYGIYVEAAAPDGSMIRRAQTFYALEPDSWQPWMTEPRVTPGANALPPGLVAEKAREKFADDIERAAGTHFTESLYTTAEGPVLLAAMGEWTGDEGPLSQLREPLTMDLEYHVRLKRRVLGVEEAYPALKLPALSDTPAIALTDGGPEAAGMNPAVVGQLREICRSWTETDGLPIVVCIARRGSIVFHEAFGEYRGKPATTEDRFGLASITKSFCGLLLAQFLDQGLIHEEDPVGKFLPDFPTKGDKVVTIRHGMNHTTGMTEHGAWGGIFNPWLDNSIANGLEFLDPGRSLIYNGMGLDLVAKVMEMVAGKSVVRLMQEQMFAPLGFDPATTVVDMGYGVTCSAEDLAKVGQLMLNRGSYGDRVFFSPETFARLTPMPYAETCPDLPEGSKLWGSQTEYGLGIAWERDGHPHAGENGVAEDALILSENTIGHGSATSCILRVDLDNEIVVAATRVSAGEGYAEHLKQMLVAVVEGIED